MMKDSERPILIIDSGMGGIIVERKFSNLFPSENKLIVMDNEFLPMGNKKPIEIQRRISKVLKKIIDYNPKMIIIACNTIDAVAYDQIQLLFPSLQIVRLITASAKVAVETSKSKNIATLATKATIESMAYHYAGALYSKNVNMLGVQCDDLARAIEYNDEIKKVFNEEVEVLKEEKFDTLILGCTHFSRIKPLANKAFKDVNIIDSTDVVVHEAEKYMEAQVKRKKHLKGNVKIIMTKDEEKFYLQKLYDENLEKEILEI